MSSVKKRILQVNVDDLGFGGVFSLVMNLQRHMPDGIVFDFCSIEKFQNTDNIKKITDRGGKYYCVGYHGNKIIRQFKNFFNILSFFKKNNYEIIHIHSDLSFKLFNYALAAKLVGIKHIILHSHSSGIDNGNRFIKRIAHEIFKIFIPKVATDYFACSKTAANWMFRKKWSHAKILYNAIELEKFVYDKKKRDDIRNHLNVANDFVLGNVGRFAYQKNHTFLIDIFSELVKINPESKLLLIGEGELLSGIKNRVDDLKLTDKVIFYGTSNKIYELIQAMDVFVLPSRFEGLGIVAIESQAAGLPTICSDAIPPEAKVTNLFLQLKLEESPERWVEEILKFKGNYRKNVISEIKKNGYDIKDVSENLYKYYCSLE